MPRLDIDMFDETPKVGDKVKVTGKIKSIDEDSGEVEVTYDDVNIVKKHKKRNRDDDSSDMDTEIVEEDQSLDAALGRAFPYTQ